MAGLGRRNLWLYLRLRLARGALQITDHLLLVRKGVTKLQRRLNERLVRNSRVKTWLRKAEVRTDSRIVEGTANLSGGSCRVGSYDCRGSAKNCNQFFKSPHRVDCLISHRMGSSNRGKRLCVSDSAYLRN